MERTINTAVWATTLAVTFCLLAGCAEPAKTPGQTTTDPGTTIGSVAEIFTPAPMPVEGFGLVGGLAGTGSSECPPQVREYLKQYILAQLPAEHSVDVEQLINSRDTAVVRVQGTMPPAVTKNQTFDVRVNALPDSQTTSLAGGWLYEAELKRSTAWGISTRTLAKAIGAIFTNTIEPRAEDARIGYVLGGGRVLNGYGTTLELRRPDYLLARRISDILNSRFGPGTARAASNTVIELKVPLRYANRRDRFVGMVRAMYFSETAALAESRIESLVDALVGSPDKEASEIGLEAIGVRSVRRVSTVLHNPNEEVRLRAARCMVNLGSDLGLDVLREIATDRGSTFRVEALEAMVSAANRRDAAGVCRRLLRDESFEIRLAAYEQLRRLDDVSLTRELVGDNFHVEQIAGTAHKEVYVTRSGQARIVLFGGPMRCREDVFVQSATGEITIDARGGQDYVSVIRTVPKRSTTGPARLKSTFELADIIRTLCEEPIVEEGSGKRPGLNVPYAEAIAVLKQLCGRGAVDARFRAGPLPQVD